MRVIETVNEVARWPRTGDIVLVPTMGALHEGHRELIKTGKTLAKKEGTLIVSIYVNPTQFNDKEDLKSYPKTFKQDYELCKEEGVDMIFYPSDSEMYSGIESVSVTEKKLTQHLCGATRQGHFDGVCTIVTKLFNIIKPTTAVFGKKDYQQLAIIKQLVSDLNFSIEIIGAETIREQDGLAISSRNRFLSTEERKQCPAIHEALVAMALSTEKQCPELIALGKSIIESEAPLSRIDYLEIVDRQTMEPIQTIDRPALAAVAIILGNTRLIDNIEIDSL
ncbi:MAG: pantoate--beta-alanine ligase [Verrucomicrobiales bacterium]|nr:pantoate--beta-alanine ligase [Verrucomicrobiales bacterium]